MIIIIIINCDFTVSIHSDLTTLKVHECISVILFHFRRNRSAHLTCGRLGLKVDALSTSVDNRHIHTHYTEQLLCSMLLLSSIAGADAAGRMREMHPTQVNSALHPSGVAKSSTSFGFGKGGKVTSAGWQVTLCDLIWHVISRSGVVISITNCYIRVYFTFYFNSVCTCSRFADGAD